MTRKATGCSGCGSMFHTVRSCWHEERKLPADQERWAFGPLCILLDEVQALPRAVPCSGMLGFWTVPAAIERAMWSAS